MPSNNKDKDERLYREPGEHIIRPNASYSVKERDTPYWARRKVNKPHRSKSKTRKIKKVRSSK